MNVVLLPGCEYGDHATWCKTMASSGCYVNKETCCKTCKELKSNDASKFGFHDATKILYMFLPQQVYQCSTLLKYYCRITVHIMVFSRLSLG